ncbi:hypothetical protein [Bacillus timonensis]|uniref:hypothetical protein n=1 Tax=Bacillus timonensis TaxID=1033734 RepID=UPI000288A7B1|nr:hypothetical protein [Bacillus timonensis]
MKWKNYGLWVSLASILYMVFKDFGMQIDLTTWETYVTAILGFLATLGIISNPDKGRGFFDKIPDTPAEAIAQVTEQLTNQDQPTNNQQKSSSQNPGNVQQYPEFPQQPMVNQPQTQQYQNVKQEYPAQTNVEQNEHQGFQNQQNIEQNGYQEYQAQQNAVQPNQQNNSSHNQPSSPQNIELSQVQPEMNVESEEYDTTQEQAPNNSTYDRNSIHGMPVPPNEYM